MGFRKHVVRSVVVGSAGLLVGQAFAFGIHIHLPPVHVPNPVPVIVKPLEKAADVVVDTGKKAADTAAKAGEAAVKGGSEAAGAVAHTAEKVGGAVVDVAKDAGSTAGQTVIGAAHDVGEAGKATVKVVGDAAGGAEHAVAAGAEKAGDAATQVANTVKDTGERVGSAVSHLPQVAEHAARTGDDFVKAYVQESVRKVKEGRLHEAASSLDPFSVQLVAAIHAGRKEGLIKSEAECKRAANVAAIAAAAYIGGDAAGPLKEVGDTVGGRECSFENQMVEAHG